MAMQIRAINFRIRVGMNGGSGVELKDFRVHIHVGFASDVQDSHNLQHESYVLEHRDDVDINAGREITGDDSPAVPRAITVGELSGTLQTFLNTQETNIETKESAFTHTASQNTHKLVSLRYAIIESRDASMLKRGQFGEGDSPAVPRDITGGELSGTLQAFIDSLEADIRSKETTIT